MESVGILQNAAPSSSSCSLRRSAEPMNLLSLLRVAARRIPGLVSRLNRRESRPPSFFGAMQDGESAASLAMGLSPSLCSADGVRSERLRRLQLLGSSPRIRLGRRISFCVPMVWRLRVFMLALWTRSRVASLANSPCVRSRIRAQPSSTNSPNSGRESVVEAQLARAVDAATWSADASASSDSAFATASSAAAFATASSAAAFARDHLARRCSARSSLSRRGAA